MTKSSGNDVSHNNRAAATTKTTTTTLATTAATATTTTIVSILSRQAHDVFVDAVGEDHEDVGSALNLLAVVMGEQGRYLEVRAGAGKEALEQNGAFPKQIVICS